MHLAILPDVLETALKVNEGVPKFKITTDCILRKSKDKRQIKLVQW